MTGQNPIMNQQELTSDVAPISESAFRPDGTFSARIITEGWGLFRLSFRKVLSEAAGLYKKGTRMFITPSICSELKERL